MHSFRISAIVGFRVSVRRHIWQASATVAAGNSRRSFSQSPATSERNSGLSAGVQKWPRSVATRSPISLRLFDPD